MDGASIPKARVLKARQSNRPRIDKFCLQQAPSPEEYVNVNVPGLELAPLMTGTTAADCTSGLYLFRKLKQEWFLAQMNDLLTILNDLKGPNSDETIRIAATVNEMVSATRSWKASYCWIDLKYSRHHSFDLSLHFISSRRNIRTIYTTLRV